MYRCLTQQHRNPSGRLAADILHPAVLGEAVREKGTSARRGPSLHQGPGSLFVSQMKKEYALMIFSDVLGVISSFLFLVYYPFLSPVKKVSNICLQPFEEHL